jgi:hypothetical protein
MSASAAIFSDSCDVTTGVPKAVQHLAHLSIRQSRRVALVAGTRRSKPLLLAFTTAFISVQVIIKIRPKLGQSPVFIYFWPRNKDK